MYVKTFKSNKLVGLLNKFEILFYRHDECPNKQIGSMIKFSHEGIINGGQLYSTNTRLIYWKFITNFGLIEVFEADHYENQLKRKI